MELMKYSITLLLISQHSTEDSHHSSDVSRTDCKHDLAKPFSFYKEYLDRKYQIKGGDVGLNAKDVVAARILLVPHSNHKSLPCRQLFLQNTSVEVYPFLTVQHVFAVVYVSSARSILLAKRYPREIISFNIDSHKYVLWKDNVASNQMVVENERNLVFLSCFMGFARAKTDGKEFKHFAKSLRVCGLATDTYNRTVYVISTSWIISYTYGGQMIQRTAVRPIFMMVTQVYAHRKVLYFTDHHRVYGFSLLSNKLKVIKDLRFKVKSAVFYKDNIYMTYFRRPCRIVMMDLLNKTTYSLFNDLYSRESMGCFETCLIE